MRIGKYEVEAEVAEGGSVRVFDGWDRATGRRVTLKILTDVADTVRVDRFRREVAAVANVSNAGLISVYELGEHVGMPFAALEYLGPDHLGHAISGCRPLSLLEKMRVMWQVAEGVQAAHEGGLAYIGLCPAGIVLCPDGSAKVSDFGMVRLTADLAGKNTEYLESLPEGAALDPLSDVFAYGIIYYELLTGTHPFLGSGASAGKSNPASLRELAPECPELLERLVARSMEIDRELRYQSLEDVRFDAEPILRELERARARALLQHVRECVESGKPDEALRALRESLELDPANADAQRLRGELRSRAQERTLRSRLESLLHDAEQEIAALRIERAAELLESAARLDAAGGEAGSRIQAIRGVWEQSRKTRQLLDEARKALEEKDLIRAETKVLEALERSPENPEAAKLADAVGEAILRQQAEAHVEDGIAKAKSLLLIESFDAALSVLADLENECPGSPAVARWRTHIQQQKQQHQRRIRIETQLAGARRLMTQLQFTEAAEALESLQTEFPEEAQISDLLTECAEASERILKIFQAREQCDSFCRAEQFESAFRVLDTTQSIYPDDPEVAELRREVQQKHREFEAAVSVRQALAEVQWLLAEDRVDLALPFLREKVAAMPDQPALAARLAAIEAMQPAWEQRRLIEDALQRAAALEQAQQESVALTILEEALQACPASEELQQAARTLRSQLQEQERRKKLARWMSEIRQAMADGDCELAEQTLARAWAALPDESDLKALRVELEEDKKFREEWRLAQVLVARRQFDEAERILAGLDGSRHPEVRTLLKATEEARAAGEQQDFYKREREKARNLVEQGRKDQAAGLLRNLLSLFPGDAILERDLQAIERAPRNETREGGPPESASPEKSRREPFQPETAAISMDLEMPRPIEKPRPMVVLLPPREEPPRSPYGRWIMVAGAGLVLVVSVGAVTGIFHNPAASKARAAAVTTVRHPAGTGAAFTPAVAPQTPMLAPPLVALPPEEINRTRRMKRSGEADPEQTPAKTRRRASEPPPQRRSFSAATLPGSAKPARMAADLPPAPGGVTVSQAWIPELPVGVSVPLQAPAPPPRELPAAAKPAPAPLRPAGGKLNPVQPISAPAPAMPQFARERHVWGTVKLDAMVDQTGAVTKIKVLSGDPLLISAAKQGVAKWRYRPATLNGQPIEAEVQIEVRFESANQ